MSARCRWLPCSLAAAVLVVASGSASAQIGQPGGLRPAAQGNPQPSGQPNPNAHNPFLMPSINSWPGLPYYPTLPPVVGLPDGSDQGQGNPGMNRANVARRNPFAMNPFWANPFVLNPLLRNPGHHAINNPFAVPGYDSRFTPEFTPPATPPVSYILPVAIRQPAMLQWKAPDLQLTPGTGTIFRPANGVVTLADGSTFYRVPGTGIFSRPGRETLFMPYIR